MNKIKTGKFIVLEGINSCGKSEVIKQLKEEYPDILFNFEPSGSYRKILLHETKDLAVQTEILLYVASRIENIRKNILPAISSGHFFIFFWFYLSLF
jgi:thymidylate kinase